MAPSGATSVSIPLLDGLDELPAARQEPCVRSINLFLRDHRPSHLVVCCRVAEYENLETRLQLNGAIRLLPFHDEQIREYLARAGMRRTSGTVSATDPEFLELARSPLLLGMMASAHDEMSRDAWPSVASGLERRDHLFDLYARHLLLREGASGRYSETQTTAWLARLADMLQRQGQSDFLIERMQPDWLQSETQRWLYRVAVAVLTAVVVYVPAAAHEQVDRADPPWSSRGSTSRRKPRPCRLYGDVMMMLIALVAGFIVAARSTIVPIETVRWSGEQSAAGGNPLARLRLPWPGSVAAHSWESLRARALASWASRRSGRSSLVERSPLWMAKGRSPHRSGFRGARGGLLGTHLDASRWVAEPGPP